MLKADTAMDMWAVGVVLYQLCTGQALFQVSQDGSVSEDVSIDIFGWNNDLKEEKLNLVGNRCAKSLLYMLLTKDPSQRPSASRALCHPFITGMIPTRLIGEAPQFDVYLSYRAEADSAMAELVYNALVALNLRVWWDKVKQLPGFSWETSFADGLVNSSCCVCIISQQGIKNSNIASQNFGKLELNSSCDNLLLEWRMALEFKEKGLLKSIFPVFVVDSSIVSDTIAYSMKLDSGCHPRELPTTSVKAVEAGLSSNLNRLGLAPQHWKELQVVDIVGEIVTKHRGDFLRKEQLESSCSTVASRIAKLIDKRNPMPNVPTSPCILPTAVSTISVSTES